MPSDYSLFRKIQVVLDIATSAEVHSLLDLNAELISRRPPNFFSKQYDKNHDAIVHDVSRRGVRKAINICKLLGLIDDDGLITNAGRRALRTSAYSRVLATQVRQFLEANGIQIDGLVTIISKSLRSDPLVMPTSTVLWEKSGTKLHLILFSQMLTLLAHCGVVESFQRKIYLRFRQ